VPASRLALVLSVALAAAGVAACSAVAPSKHVNEVAVARTWVFVCPDESIFVVRASATSAWLFRNGSSVRLGGVATAESLQFSGAGLSLQIDGEIGTLTEPGRAPAVCRNDRRRAVWEQAKLDGVEFRAVGNEPPWVLELREGSRIVLITEYGARRIERHLPPSTSDVASKTTRWEAGDLRIELSVALCHDSMDGESFETRVVVHWQGRTFRGCGRALH